MSYSDTQKKSSLLITKITKKSTKEPILRIYNINELTNNELKVLIQNFFENDNHKNSDKYDISLYNLKKNIHIFSFENKEYWVQFIGEKNDFKESIIKFLNFLKNIMVGDFSCFGYEYDIDVDIINLIGEVIKNSKVIKSVFLLDEVLKNNDGFKILCEYLKNHESLKRLHFGHSFIDKLSKKNIGLLVDVIKSSTIEYIDGLHKDDYYIVFEDLMNNFFLSKPPQLNFYQRHLNDDLVLKLSNMIIDKNINYVKEINFSSSIITSKGFTILFDSLLKSKNENIIEIRILNSELGDDCIEKLGELIKQNENISHILLGSNNITDKGIEILSGYIIGNTSIVSINLSHNHGITESSFEIIKNMIKSSTVSSFGIRGIEISEEFLEKIDELLEIPIDKREIPLITNFDVKSASKRMKEEET